MPGRVSFSAQIDNMKSVSKSGVVGNSFKMVGNNFLIRCNRVKPLPSENRNWIVPPIKETGTSLKIDFEMRVSTKSQNYTQSMLSKILYGLIYFGLGL